MIRFTGKRGIAGKRHAIEIQPQIPNMSPPWVKRPPAHMTIKEKMPSQQISLVSQVAAEEMYSVIFIGLVERTMEAAIETSHRIAHRGNRSGLGIYTAEW